MTDTHNVFAGAYIDRASEFRADSRWLAHALNEPDTRYLLVAEGRCLASKHYQCLRLLKSGELPAKPNLEQLIFLGLQDKSPVFAMTVDAQICQTEEFDDFIDLRTLGSFLGPIEANLAAHAVGMTHWRETQRFCTQCGHESQIEAAGYAAHCSNEHCLARIFPRVDPAIIVLVERGDYCLLGRQSSWPTNMYSTIAGFVEPGESLEDAVAREVFEETNVHVDAVRYLSSQPWPFPASLMIGFHANALSEDIVTNDGELEDARWFHRDQLVAAEIGLPPRQSISRRLIMQWLDATKSR